MKRWFKYVSPYKAYFILGPLCMILEVIGEVLMPKFLSMIINNAATNTPMYSVGVSALMVLTAVIMMLGGVGGSYFGAKASVNFAADLREDIYSRVQEFSFSNIDKFSTGSLVTRLTNDVTQLQNFVNMLLRMALRAPGMLIGAIIMAVLLRPDLATVLAITIPLMLISILGIITKGFSLFSKVQKKVDGLNSTVQENVTNTRVVRSFVREDFENDKFKKANSELKSAGLKAMRTMILISPIMTLFMNLTTLAVVWFGGNIVIGGSMPIGDLSAFITYVTQILSSLMMVTFMMMMSSRALASAGRISEVLDEDIDLSDENASQKEKIITVGEIEFKNVSFRYYKNSQDCVLNAINLKIPARSTVGIIGSTGCGKTTLVSMIPRLYDCDEGEVLVDNVNVKDYSLYNLREGIGMVLQKNTLFSGTIKDNILWGNSDATDDEIEYAAQQAAADKFINNFNKGYEYDLGQGGSNVSGGQKQRLCIARALIKKPKIIILDDSTSAVDTATEAQIRKAFHDELKESTKIIIAQRITSVMDADMIVVMDEGIITGVGTHEELLKNNLEYQEIYYSQMEKKEAQ
ncbi:MAG: ABC transporter ATP-binding protein [Clostridia bacterium]|nr:ABC transporter ATP-binding protein [Clostridia bacterium]